MNNYKCTKIGVEVDRHALNTKIAKMSVPKENFFSPPDVTFWAFKHFIQSNYIPVLHMATYDQKQQFINIVKSVIIRDFIRK